MNAVILNSNKEIVAFLNTELKSGTLVRYSSIKTRESINANRDFNLVNASTGKISHAKKYVTAQSYAGFAEELNPGEFLI